MRLILVRHGETDHNRGGLTLGRADVPLNARGRLQAHALASSFVRAPDALYASPRARTRDTADAISRATRCAVIDDSALIEMEVGDAEHLTRDELRARYPEFLRQWIAEPADARMPGGETLAEVQSRAWSAIERMRAAHGDGEVVAVAHNFVIATVVCQALGLPLARFRAFRIGLASRTTIDLTPSGAVLIGLSDRSHLAARGLAS